ncbi:MAG: ribonuclease P protein component [Marinicella sp.]|nr:ribonuclease P protein component [Xanthomonadales bacterium]
MEQFPKGKRLLTRLDFSRVFSKSKRIQNQYFTVLLHYTQSSQPPRLGLVVSKKIDKLAVKRNRIKRLIRESFRMKKQLKSADYVVMAKPGVSKIGNQLITESLNQLWQKCENNK